MARRTHIWIPVLISLALAGAALAAEGPVAVSPGDATTLALIRDDCPTFSWGEVEGAKSYDLVVYRLGEQNEYEEPVLRRSFPGSVDGWTPALDQCLERGGGYAWSVRAVGGKEASEWSVLSLFEVAAGPSEREFEQAVAVVRQYLEQQDTGRTVSGPSPVSGPVTAMPQTAGIVGPTPLSLVGAGDPALQVNGSPVLTEATLGASCYGRRWLDQGDGTVLDCNTRLIWLKDAGCLGSGPWGSVFTPGTAQNAVGFLNSGLSVFSCTDYTNGTYTNWRVPTIQELCRAGDAAGICPMVYYSISLIDTRFPGPKVVSNADGDGKWVDGDPFVGVQEIYWSATERDSSAAWVAGLNAGEIGGENKDFNYNVWPVRSGQ